MSARGFLRNLKVTLVSLVTNGANPAADVVLIKSADKTVTTGSGAQVQNLTTETKTMADEPKVTAEIQKAIETAVAAAGKDKDAKIEVLQKQLTERDQVVAKIEADRRHETYQGRVKTLDKLPGLTAALLEKAEDGMTEQEAKDFTAVLSGAQEIIRQGALFSEMGRAGASATGATGKLDGIAKSLQQQDPKLSYERAYAKALKDNPELYRQYQSEKGGR